MLGTQNSPPNIWIDLKEKTQHRKYIICVFFPQHIQEIKEEVLNILGPF